MVHHVLEHLDAVVDPDTAGYCAILFDWVVLHDPVVQVVLHDQAVLHDPVVQAVLHDSVDHDQKVLLDWAVFYH